MSRCVRVVQRSHMLAHFTWTTRRWKCTVALIRQCCTSTSTTAYNKSTSPWRSSTSSCCCCWRRRRRRRNSYESTVRWQATSGVLQELTRLLCCRYNCWVSRHHAKVSLSFVLSQQLLHDLFQKSTSVNPSPTEVCRANIVKVNQSIVNRSNRSKYQLRELELKYPQLMLRNFYNRKPSLHQNSRNVKTTRSYLVIKRKRYRQ